MLKSLFVIFILFLYLGCTDLFSTREDEVEKPDPNTTSGVFEEATTAENVLKNFSRSLEQKNVAKYGENFSNPIDNPVRSFRFIGDANFADQLTENWSYTDEINYFNNIVFSNENNSPSIRFSYVDSIPNTFPINLQALDDSVETDFFRYQLEIENRDTTKIYIGLTKFKLFKSLASAKEAWFIYYWADIALNENIDRSWTSLKLENR